jgi:hypothetical protein
VNAITRRQQYLEYSIDRHEKIPSDREKFSEVSKDKNLRSSTVDVVAPVFEREHINSPEGFESESSLGSLSGANLYFHAHAHAYA